MNFCSKKMGTFIEITDLKSLTYAVIYEFLKSIVMLLWLDLDLVYNVF